MGLFKTPEEREIEARERAEADRRAAEHQRLLAASAEDARRKAAFAATPVGRARAAFERGDRFFQAEIEVSQLTGTPSMFGSSENAITRRDDQGDVLGRIEDEGWRLEHVGYVFVETGSTSTDRMLFTGQGTVTEGLVTGVYLFRRAEANRG